MTPTRMLNGERVRKGTHSCWEWKRRKMKCRFDPRIVSASCNGCRRRGSQYISQEFPEDLASVAMGIGSVQNSSDGTPFGGRTRAATLSGNSRADHSTLTPMSMNLKPSRYLASYNLPSNTVLRPGMILGRQPHNINMRGCLGSCMKSLPSREYTESICKASRHSSILSHESLTTPYATIYQNGFKTPDSLLITPQPNMHPVLIARHMLQLAIFLQHLHPDLHKEIKDLSEPPQVIMELLVIVASCRATTNNKFLDSIERLECIMLEGLYQVNLGNLRQSWIVGRRAMSVAQLISLHQLNSTNQTLYKVLDPPYGDDFRMGVTVMHSVLEAFKI